MIFSEEGRENISNYVRISGVVAEKKYNCNFDKAHQ